MATTWAGASPVPARAGGAVAGDRALGWAFLAGVAAAFAAYLAGLALLARREAPLRSVGAVAVAIQLLPLAAPLLLSTDAWSYWQYGAMDDPYADAPRDDPRAGFAWMGEDWRGTTSVYGPAFTLASRALASTSDPAAAAWAFKAAAAAAVLVCTWLAARLAVRKAAAAAFVGWNPLLAVHFAGGGHNDAWLAALVLAALALAAAGRGRWAGAAWALAVLVKWVPLVFLGLRALEARGRRRVDHAGFAVTLAAVLGAATLLWGLDWLRAFGPLARNVAEQTSYALPSRVPGGEALALVGLAAGLGWLVREARRGRARLGLAAGVLLLATPWLTAWYVVWAVPLAAAEEDRTAKAVSLALGVYLLPQAVPL